MPLRSLLSHTYDGMTIYSQNKQVKYWFYIHSSIRVRCPKKAGCTYMLWVLSHFLYTSRPLVWIVYKNVYAIQNWNNFHTCPLGFVQMLVYEASSSIYLVFFFFFVVRRLVFESTISCDCFLIFSRSGTSASLSPLSSSSEIEKKCSPCHAEFVEPVLF